MKKRLQGFIAGALVGVMIAGGTALAVSTTTLYDVITSGVSIVMDGNKLIPRDANGNVVEPIIYNGTTYLPVRAISNAVGKAVYWDGPNYTVYLGDMDGELEYPTVSINDVDNIGSSNFNKIGSNNLTDNYGNSYSYAIANTNGSSTRTFQTLLNMKYSKFKATIYVPKGFSRDSTTKILIKADGKTVWSSPEMTKTSRPINVDVNIKGCNDFQIEVDNSGYCAAYIANGGFYQ